MSSFKSQFSFNPEHAFKVGCEREGFIVDSSGEIVPEAKKALDALGLSTGYELSACQLESRVGPVDFDRLEYELCIEQAAILEILFEHGLSVKYITVAPETMPLDVFPDPTGRYQKIVEKMPREILLAACRVAGTHCHVGMSDFETALIVYNHVVDHVHELIEMGNLTQGERLGIYQMMAPNFMPIKYRDLQHMHEYYVENGFDVDPRKCWHLIRISVHGTIEFRMFDSTESINIIASWARECLKLCRQALELVEA